MIIFELRATSQIAVKYGLKRWRFRLNLTLVAAPLFKGLR
jgi:hypothetical protein